MIDLALIFNLMKDAEKIYKGDLTINKKDYVLKCIRKIIGDHEYNENLGIIDNVIEFIIFLSVNQKMLKDINRKAMQFCCK